MGLLRDHANLLKVELPSCDNSGVYAIIFYPFCLGFIEFGQTYQCGIDSTVIEMLMVLRMCKD